MVTNHLRAPHGVYFTKIRTILRRPYGVLPAAGRIVRFLFKIYIVRFQRCPSGHGTVSDKRRKLSKNLLTNRLMPVRAPDDAHPDTGRCFMRRTATAEKRRVFAEEHIAFTKIFHF